MTTVADKTQTQTDTPVKESQSAVEPTPKYTDTDLQKAVNDALREAGREAKALKDERASLDKERQELNTLKDTWLKTEAELAADDPDATDIIESKKKWRNKVLEVETKEKDVIDREKAVLSTATEIAIAQVAIDAGIKQEVLKEKVQEYGITSKENMLSLAVMLKGTSTIQKQPESNKIPDTEINTNTPASKGGNIDFASLSPKEQNKIIMEKLKEKG